MPADTLPKLKLRTPDGMVTERAIEVDRVTLGRSSKCTVQLPSADVSREHAELVRDPMGQWWLHDLGSAIGVLVNNVPTTEALLNSGDIVHIGPYELAVVIDEDNDPLAQHLPLEDAAVRDDTNDTRITSFELGAQAIDLMHLTAIREFGTRLIQTSDIAERLRLLCRVVVRKEFHGLAAGALRVRRDPRGRPQPKRLCDIQFGRRDAQPPHISKSLIKTVMKPGLPHMAKTGKGDGQSVQMTMVSGPDGGGTEGIVAMACPLRSTDHETDMLYCVFPREFGEANWLILVSMLCQQFQQAEAMRKIEDTKRAEAIVKKLYEQAQQMGEQFAVQTKVFEGLDVAAHSTACPWVGGDLYETLVDASGRAVLIVGEVNGTGLPAAYRVGCVRSMIRAFFAAGMSLNDALRNLHRQLREALGETTEARLAAVAIETPSGAVDWVLAGHPSPVLIDPSGDAQRLSATPGRSLGRGELGFTNGSARLGPGEMLLLYTDGLTKVPEGLVDTLSIDRVVERIASALQSESASAQSVLADVRSLHDQLLGKRKIQDDQTMLLARRPAS